MKQHHVTNFNVYTDYSTKLGNFLSASIALGARFLMGLLLLVSILFQGVLFLPKGEWVAILPNKVWPFFIMAILISLLYFSRKYLAKMSNKTIFIVGSLLYLLLGLLLIFWTSDALRYDAEQVFRSALQMNSGDYHSLDIGNYLYRFPHQLGLVTFERLITKLIPTSTSLIFFVLNVSMVIGINFALWKISDTLFHDETISRYTILLSFAFLPQLFHILFVYGLIFGLFFSSFGLLFLLDFLKKGGWQSGWLSLLFLVVAYWIRNNYIILLVTVIVVLVLDTLKRKRWKKIVYIPLLLLLAWGINKGTCTYYEFISGQDLEGMPKTTWFAMGLQDTPSNVRQPGWYNFYVTRIYRQKLGDYKAIDTHAKKVISDRWKTFEEDPIYAATFFGRKFATTWTESTFASVWSGPSKFDKQEHRTSFLVDLYQGGISYKILYQFTHAILLLIYSGAFLFLFRQKISQISVLTLYPYIYLAGGVLFHLLWETKSQYVYPYVYLLIPLSVSGYLFFFEKWKRSRACNKSLFKS